MQKIGIVSKNGTKEHKSQLVETIEFLRKEKKEIFIDENTARIISQKRYFQTKTIAKKSDMIIVFGGDGTILKTAQVCIQEGTPILGAKVGGLGILTQTTPQRLVKDLKRIFKKKYKLDKRTLLDLKIGNRDIGTALNEIAITQGPFERLINFKVKVGGELMDFCADGVIVSTPTGSTAYSYAAGGPIVKKNKKFFIVTPICPMGRKVKPLLVSDKSKITIEMKRYHNDAENIGLSVDGQKNIILDYKDKIRVQKAKTEIGFIVPK